MWNRSAAQVGCMRQVLGPGALGRPRGIRWRGRWEGGSGWGTHVTPWLSHVNVWQNPLQYCKIISLQLIKINEKKQKVETHLRFFIKGSSSGVESQNRSVEWGMSVQPHSPCIGWLALGASVPQFSNRVWIKLSSVFLYCSFIVVLMMLMQSCRLPSTPFFQLTCALHLLRECWHRSHGCVRAFSKICFYTTSCVHSTWLL